MDSREIEIDRDKEIDRERGGEWEIEIARDRWKETDGKREK